MSIAVITFESVLLKTIILTTVTILVRLDRNQSSVGNLIHCLYCLLINYMNGTIQLFTIIKYCEI